MIFVLIRFDYNTMQQYNQKFSLRLNFFLKAVKARVWIKIFQYPLIRLKSILSLNWQLNRILYCAMHQLAISVDQLNENISNIIYELSGLQCGIAIFIVIYWFYIVSGSWLIHPVFNMYPGVDCDSTISSCCLGIITTHPPFLSGSPCLSLLIGVFCRQNKIKIRKKKREKREIKEKGLK